MSDSSSNAKPVRAGRTLGDRYTLVNRIAKGGMGEVWRARDRRSGMLVAAKVLRPELTGEEISLSRLRLEAENTMRARHPNIAMVMDSGEDEGQGWIVMELVQGRPLTDFMGDGKQLTAEQLVPILIQTAYALDGSAQAGIVHRDIKPANILIREDGMVKLTDFGISYSRGQANLTAVGMVMGTAQYLAPEQAMGGEATPSGDLYSLGVIAYEALAGHRPFTGKSAIDIAMAHVKEEAPDLPDTVPDPMADIVFGLLAKDPADRPQSGTALVRTLTRAANEMGIGTSPMPLPEPKKGEGSDGDAEPRLPTPEQLEQTEPEVVAPKPAIQSPAEVQAPPSYAVPKSSPEPAPQPRSLPPSMSWKPVDVSSFPIRPKADAALNTVSAAGAATSQRPSSSSARPGDYPARVSSSPEETETTPPGESRIGMWIIAGLIALTVILIIIAMIQNRAESGASAPDVLPMFESIAETRNLEVASWLSPVLDS